ncbi:phage integrase central domain-containing protein [Salmonella enterica]|uniref:phage integrase central domain-containing protein n=1 Tax=Salmonella enterica TaxID=28901 RepID=UPI003F711EF5
MTSWLFLPARCPPQKSRRQNPPLKITTDSLFINVATRWFAVKKSSGISDVHADDIWKSLEKDVFPAIGQTPVTELKAHTLIAALEPVRARGALETLRRLTQRINKIMKFAVNSGLLDANPASTIASFSLNPCARYWRISSCAQA